MVAFRPNYISTIMGFELVTVLLVMLTVVCRGQDVLQYSVIEESNINTFIGNVSRDSNLRSTVSEEVFNQIEYSFLTQENGYEQYFSIDQQNGIINTQVRIDRENITDCKYTIKCVLSLSVVAKSKVSAFFRTLKVDITVVDINDNTPSFPAQSTSISIFELATVGSSISIVGAVDSDAGNFSLQRYYIKDISSLNIPFNTSYETYVDGSSVVKLILTGDLDREKQDIYSIVIEAEDGGDPRKTGSITVDIEVEDANDNSPKFTQNEYNATINETSPIGTEITTLTATDADLGVNSEIIYSLSRNQIDKIHELFAINETTGVLIVKGKFTSGGQFRIIVEAVDQGEQPLLSQTVVIVTVVDSDNNPPEINVNLFTDTGLGSVSEYASIGTVVAHIALKDSDTGANGIIKCEITSDNDVFALEGFKVNEYKVTVAKQIDRESFDYIYVVINCYDRGTPPLQTFSEFTVQVMDENDHDPEFLQEVYFVDINENNDRKIDLVQVTAVDGDINKNGEISYSIWAEGQYQFYMDPLSGIITTMSIFNRETDPKITFYAYAKDFGSPARTSTATIVINVLDLNDNSPKFDELSVLDYSIRENEPIGTSIAKLNVSDEDTGDNARLSFFIDEQLPFTIDSHATLRTKEVLNRESIPIYNFTVTVYDQGVPPRNTSAHVTVRVKDDNDHAPQFVFPDVANHTIEMDAETQPKTVIATIRAFDLDEGINKQLFYTIVNKNVSDLFAIDIYTGTITLLRPITLDDQPLYYILLRVDDNGNPRQFTTTSLNVFITRTVTPPPVKQKKGENLLIAITLGTVTFVLVFTIILVICLLKRRGRQLKESNDCEDRFYDKEKPNKEKRVQFADLSSTQSKPDSKISMTTVKNLEAMTTYPVDCNESRDSDMTSSTVDMETPILDKNMETQVKNSTASIPNMSILSKFETSPVDMETRHSTPRSENQLATLQSHSALLHSTIQPHASFSTFGHEDNHSQTSGETITSDSGRGGSETDIHSSSLSQSHDSDIKQNDFRHYRNIAHSTFSDIQRPWMNLADLQHHRCEKIPIARQLHNDQRARLQLKNFADKNKYRNSERMVRREPCTLDHSQPRVHRQVMSSFRNQPLFPLPPPSEHDRSFMTYDDDDDDMSTTTSGSYTIDHEDVTLDLRTAGVDIPGLRSCLV